MAGQTVFPDPCGPLLVCGTANCVRPRKTLPHWFNSVIPIRCSAAVTDLIASTSTADKEETFSPSSYIPTRSVPLGQSSCIRPYIRNCNAKRDQIYAAVIKSRYIEVGVTSVPTHFLAASLLSTRRPCHEKILRTSAARQHDLDARRLRRTWPECGGSRDRRPQGYFNSPAPAKRNHYDHAQGDSNDNTGVAPRTNCDTTTDYDS